VKTQLECHDQIKKYFNTFAPTLRKNIFRCLVTINVQAQKQPNFAVRLISVQQSFTKRLPGLSNLPFTKRLEFLGIDSLEIRRLRYALVFVYEMLFEI